MPATFLQPGTFTLWAPGQLAGLIRRIEQTNSYVLTSDGTRIAVFYTKLHNWLLRPLLAADQSQKVCQDRPASSTSAILGSGPRIVLTNEFNEF